MVLGVSRFSGFRGGVVMTLTWTHGMPQTGHLVLGFNGFGGFGVIWVSGWGRDDIRFAWTHGMPRTGHLVLGFRCFGGFGVIWVSGWGRDDIRFTWTHGMQQTRHSSLAHAFLNCACKHFSFLPRACAHWSSRSVGYVRVFGCRGFGFDFHTTDVTGYLLGYTLLHIGAAQEILFHWLWPRTPHSEMRI